MNMINQRKLTIERLYYHITGNSSEYIPRILDECTEVNNSVCIDAKFPDDFAYTPLRPFKTEHFGADKTVNWLNLEGFLNCRRITAYLFHWKTRTEQYWSSFFTKWMDSDARLEKLMLCFLEAPEFRNIMNALGKHYIVVYTKQAYLEKMNKKKEFALARKLATNLRVKDRQ
uniref:FBA_2 domain-containing protein n=2 Tax=Caenorhabditis tropicalis TaxID=1561998 RepID=A0A1I7UTJ4_9PELO